MFNRNSSLAFISLFAETSCLFLPYYLLSVLIKTPVEQTINFVQFSILIVIAGLVNWLISFRSLPLLGIAVLNIFSAILAAPLLLFRTLPTGSTIWAWLLFKGFNLTGSLQLCLAFSLTGFVFLRSMIIFNSIMVYQKTVNRFQAAMGILWGTALLAELISVPIPNIIIILALCLILNIAATALTKAASVPSRSYIAALGVLITLIFIVILLLDFSHSFMLSGSQWIYNSIFPYLGLVFYNAITWLMKKGHYLPDQKSSVTGSAESVSSSNYSSQNSVSDSHWIQLFSSGISVFAAIVLTIVLLVVVFYFAKVLLKKRSFSSTPGSPVNISFSRLITKLINRFKRFGIIMLLMQPGKLGIDLLYQGLLYWGKRKNVVREDFETPYEYCNRLSTLFPRHRERFLQITDAYVRFRFGQQYPDRRRLQALRSAFRQLLRHPF